MFLIIWPLPPQRGQVIKNKCKTCKGTGRIKKDKSVEVTIPAGVYDGYEFKIPGKGEAGKNGGPAGDLIIRISVKPDAQFERKGNDVITEVHLSYPDAVLGTKILVPTLTGKAELKIPPGTESGKIFRLRGKGIKDVRGYGVGDQYVKVIVDVPKKVSKKAKELLKELKEVL